MKNKLLKIIFILTKKRKKCLKCARYGHYRFKNEKIMSTLIEIKKCPMCRSDGKLFLAENFFWYVQCSNIVCHLKTEVWSCKETAIKKWNMDRD